MIRAEKIKLLKKTIDECGYRVGWIDNRQIVFYVNGIKWRFVINKKTKCFLNMLETIKILKTVYK